MYVGLVRSLRLWATSAFLTQKRTQNCVHICIDARCSPLKKKNLHCVQERLFTLNASAQISFGVACVWCDNKKLPFLCICAQCGFQTTVVHKRWLYPEKRFHVAFHVLRHKCWRCLMLITGSILDNGQWFSVWCIWMYTADLGGCVHIATSWTKHM